VFGFSLKGVFPSLLGSLHELLASAGVFVLAAIFLPFLSRFVGFSLITENWLYYWVMAVNLLFAFITLILFSFVCKIVFTILSILLSWVSPYIR
jgi:hypothetical protein